MTIKLAIISAGLGKVKRGFEVSAMEWYNNLENDERLSVKLFSGGNNPHSHKILNISRTSFFTQLLIRSCIVKTI